MPLRAKARRASRESVEVRDLADLTRSSSSCSIFSRSPLLGNDARWNAESQIQLRDYGRERMHGCELLPSRYDQVVTALGGHGELVDNAADLPGAIERALGSGKPACINIMVERAAPVVRQNG